MIDYSLFTDPGGRENNEDYVACSNHGDGYCFVLCDGLGGHERGEVASRLVAETVTELFKQEGNSADFIDRAFKLAQEKLLKLQEEQNLVNAMKTTAVVLVATPEQVKWAHIGDSRLYHFFDENRRYERTRDHSLVQRMADTGKIREEDIRNHPERNKIYRAFGAPWERKSYEKSAIIEPEGKHSFLLVTDGFWEYVYENEMLETLSETQNSADWLEKMKAYVYERADMESTDNFSAIAVRLS
jgi:serine/threonine protein phosphatase PrpC